MNISAVIVAAGNSSRMQSDKSKVMLTLSGEPVLLHTLRAFDAAPEIHQIVLVTRAEDRAEIATWVSTLQKPVTFALGDKERQGSVKNGVLCCPDAAYIAIHDGARPFITPAQIAAVCADAVRYGAATLAVPVKDTIKTVGEDGFVGTTPDRATLRAIQTPQVFRKDLYLAALEQAEQNGKIYTDDCQLVESLGQRVYLTPGDYRNIKLTTPEDLVIGEALMQERKSKA